MKWKFLLPAVFVVSMALIVNGAPVLPVVGGCVGAAAWNFWMRRGRTQE